MARKREPGSKSKVQPRLSQQKAEEGSLAWKLQRIETGINTLNQLQRGLIEHELRPIREKLAAIDDPGVVRQLSAELADIEKDLHRIGQMIGQEFSGSSNVRGTNFEIVEDLFADFSSVPGQGQEREEEPITEATQNRKELSVEQLKQNPQVVAKHVEVLVAAKKAGEEDPKKVMEEIDAIIADALSTNVPKDRTTPGDVC